MLTALYNPRAHIWAENFAWDETYTSIIGKTPIGRATVEALKLNREKLIKLRRGLFLLKEHPPKDHH